MKKVRSARKYSAAFLSLLCLSVPLLSQESYADETTATTGTGTTTRTAATTTAPTAGANETTSPASASDSKTESPSTGKKPLEADEVRLHLELATARLNKLNLDGAISEYNIVLDSEPNNLKALNGCGLAMLLKTNYAGAIAKFSSVIALTPNDQQAFVNRSQAYLLTGKFDLAEADSTKAIAIDKTNKLAAIAFNNRGVARVKSKKYDDALSDYNAALELNPRYDLALVGRGACYLGMKKYPEALADCDKAITFSPSYVRAYSVRALIKTNMADRQGAIADYSKVLQFAPTSIEAHEKRGQLRELEGDHSGAEEDFAAALQAKNSGTQSTVGAASSKDAVAHGSVGMSGMMQEVTETKAKTSDAPGATTGKIKVTPETMGQLNAADMAEAKSYLNRVAVYVKGFWRAPPVAQVERGAVDFQIEQSGELSNVHLFTSSGDNKMDETMLAAVKEAKSYSPPPDFFQTPLKVRIGFNDLHGQQRRTLSPQQQSQLNAYVRKLEQYVLTFFTPSPLAPASRVSVEFRINLDGTFKDVQVKQSSNDKAFDELAISAVNKAQKFQPPPVFAGGTVKVVITFDNTRKAKQEPSI